MDNKHERSLVEEYVDLLNKKEYHAQQTKTINKQLTPLIFRIKEYMDDNEISKTAVFDEIGSIKLMDDDLKTSVPDAHFEALEEWLKEISRTDIIKEKKGIASGAWKVFVKEQLSLGVDLPDYVNIYFMPKIKHVK